MKTDLALMEIRKVIIHEVPKRWRATDAGGPVLSEVESELDSELELYIKKRMIESLKSSQAFDIMFDPLPKSPVPGLVQQYTASPGQTDFVASSQKMATHLYGIQTGSNPAGLLIVIDCAVELFQGLGILKLEREEGAHCAAYRPREKDLRHQAAP